MQGRVRPACRACRISHTVAAAALATASNIPTAAEQWRRRRRCGRRRCGRRRCARWREWSIASRWAARFRCARFSRLWRSPRGVHRGDCWYLGRCGPLAAMRLRASRSPASSAAQAALRCLAARDPDDLLHSLAIQAELQNTLTIQAELQNTLTGRRDGRTPEHTHRPPTHSQAADKRTGRRRRRRRRRSHCHQRWAVNDLHSPTTPMECPSGSRLARRRAGRGGGGREDAGGWIRRQSRRSVCMRRWSDESAGELDEPLRQRR